MYIYKKELNDWNRYKNDDSCDQVGEDIIRKECDGYMFGKFDSRFIINPDVVFYSFDKKNKDFHMCPGDDDIYPFGDLFDKIASKLNEEDFILHKIRNKIFWGNGKTNDDWTKNHYFNYCRPNKSGYEYLIQFNRLWINEDNNTINTLFGAVQFYRYRYKDISKNDALPNKDIVRNEKIYIYPHSDENKAFYFDLLSGYCGYNAPIIFEESDTEENIGEKVNLIAEYFIDFICSCEKIPLGVDKIVKGIVL